MTRLELTQKAIGLDTGVEEYWKRVDVNGKIIGNYRETSRCFPGNIPIDDRLNNGHNEA